MNPKISVIIPTFHRPDGAKAAVQSLFAQKNAPEFEIILIDNDAAPVMAFYGEANTCTIEEIMKALNNPVVYGRIEG